MAQFDLSTGAARLRHAFETLTLRWSETSDFWSDDVSRRFAEEHLDPLGPALKNALDAIGRMEMLVQQAHRDCQPEG